MRIIRRAGLISGVLLSLTSAAPAVAATATFRVEGVDVTRVEEARVATPTAPVNKTGKPGEECPGNSVAGLLEAGTAGDWNGTYSKDFGSYFVSTIKGETHGGDPDYWTFWVNGKAAEQGICQTVVQEGDEVVFFVDRCEFDQTTFQCANEPVRPLALTVPANARRGDTVEALVTRWGSSDPVANAAVQGEGFTVGTGADGKARITIGTSGTLRLRADKKGWARSSFETICVASGETGACGTRDVTPPAASFKPPWVDGATFSAADAPRELAGLVSADTSGLRRVSLRITRRYGGRCSYFSGRLDRFKAVRCGRRHWFAVGDREDWTYLLPEALAPGRYVIDVRATDKAGNFDLALKRGQTRIVVTVTP